MVIVIKANVVIKEAIKVIVKIASYTNSRIMFPHIETTNMG